MSLFHTLTHTHTHAHLCMHLPLLFYLHCFFVVPSSFLLLLSLHFYVILFFFICNLNCVIFYKLSLLSPIPPASLPACSACALPVSTTFLLNGSLNVQINVKPLLVGFTWAELGSGRVGFGLVGYMGWVGGFQLWWGFFFLCLSVCVVVVPCEQIRNNSDKQNPLLFYYLREQSNQIISLSKMDLTRDNPA